MGQFDTQKIEGLPHVKPVLGLCHRGRVQEMGKIGQHFTNENISVTSKHLVMFGMKTFHFDTKLSLAGLLLAGEVVTMDRFVPHLLETLHPNNGKSP